MPLARYCVLRECSVSRAICRAAAVWVNPAASRVGGSKRSGVTKSCTIRTRLSKAIIATSTRLAASASCSSASRKAIKPRFSSAIGSPAMELEVSSSSTQGQRGSGLTANSTNSSRRGVSVTNSAPSRPKEVGNRERQVGKGHRLQSLAIGVDRPGLDTLRFQQEYLDGLGLRTDDPALQYADTPKVLDFALDAARRLALRQDFNNQFRRNQQRPGSEHFLIFLQALVADKTHVGLARA